MLVIEQQGVCLWGLAGQFLCLGLGGGGGKQFVACWPRQGVAGRPNRCTPASRFGPVLEVELDAGGAANGLLPAKYERRDRLIAQVCVLCTPHACSGGFATQAKSAEVSLWPGARPCQFWPVLTL